MNQPLFFEPDVDFVKVAGETTLPEDPNEWPNEIMQELYKQAPFCADFTPHVAMDRVDGERGYGFGHVEVQNKTEIQHGASPEALDSAGVQSVRIPIVIKDRKLQPLDLLITADAKMLPLTEARLRQAIFRPQCFDITGRGPGDMSMIGQLYPPYRQNYGFGGGGATMNVGMGKEGSEGFCSPAEALSRIDRMEKKGSVFKAIMPTINRDDVDTFFRKIGSDRGLRLTYLANGAVLGAIDALATYTPESAQKQASATLQRVTPDVVQLHKEVEGYTVKSASASCWMPEVQTLNRGEAVRLLGEKVVLAADETGSATMAVGEGVTEKQSPEEDKPELISQFGIYKVQDSQGRHLIGYVFPNIIDLDGTALPISLFTNGGQMSVQGEIVGINVGGGASLFEGPPQGVGAFYHLLPNGRAEATIPLTITGTVAAPEQGGNVLHCETFDGREVQVIVQPNIQQAMPSPDGSHMLIPDTFSWLPLDKAEECELIGDPDSFNKEGEALQALTGVTVRCGDGVFSLSGFPVEKLAADERQFLSVDDALFVLAGLGADLDYVQQKLGQAVAWSTPVHVRVGRYIKTAAEQVRESFEKAASHVQLFGEAVSALKKDLSKEAAVIPDPVAVDTVLSLGFLNPENLGVFISYLPVIDEAQQKVCELLLATRLGLRDIPSASLEKAMRAVEEALEGLKLLAFQRN